MTLERVNRAGVSLPQVTAIVDSTGNYVNVRVTGAPGQGWTVEMQVQDWIAGSQTGVTDRNGEARFSAPMAHTIAVRARRRAPGGDWGPWSSWVEIEHVENPPASVSAVLGLVDISGNPYEITPEVSLAAGDYDLELRYGMTVVERLRVRGIVSFPAILRGGVEIELFERESGESSYPSTATDTATTPAYRTVPTPSLQVDPPDTGENANVRVRMPAGTAHDVELYVYYGAVQQATRRETGVRGSVVFVLPRRTSSIVEQITRIRARIGREDSNHWSSFTGFFSIPRRTDRTPTPTLTGSCTNGNPSVTISLPAGKSYNIRYNFVGTDNRNYNAFLSNQSGTATLTTADAQRLGCGSRVGARMTPTDEVNWSDRSGEITIPSS